MGMAISGCSSQDGDAGTEGSAMADVRTKSFQAHSNGIDAGSTSGEGDAAISACDQGGSSSTRLQPRFGDADWRRSQPQADTTDSTWWEEV